MALAAEELTVPELSFGDRLRLARRKAGLEIEDLAPLLDRTASAISQWERDLKMPRDLLGVVEIWSAATKTPKSWLLLGEKMGNMYHPSSDELPGQGSVLRLVGSHGTPQLW